MSTSMRNTSAIVLLGLCTALGLAACPSVSELQTDLELLPKVTPEVEAAFASTVSTVTAQVLNTAISTIEESGALLPATAPAVTAMAYSKAAAVTVNNKVTTDDGGVIIVTGTLTSSGDGVEGAVEFDLKAEWTNLSVQTGTSSEKNNGSQTMTGTVGWTSDGKNDMNLTSEGSFTIGSSAYQYTIAMTLKSDQINYTGTINNKVVSGSFPSGGASTQPSIPTAACGGQYTPGVCTMIDGVETCWDLDPYYSCNEFFGSDWTATDKEYLCYQLPPLSSCPSTGRLGRCTITENGKTHMHHTYNTSDMDQDSCENGWGGTWKAN